MIPVKHEVVKEKMLKEFHDFVVKNQRIPSTKEINDKTLFTYGYGSYIRRFDTIENMIKLTDTSKLITKPGNMKRLPTKYSLNLKTWKIRKLVYNNPNAGCKELKEMFPDLTRSIRVIYYRVYKEIYGKNGSLRKKRGG